MIIHLHAHSTFSLLDGFPSVKQLTQGAKSLGSPALAITEHGNMGSVIQLIEECKKAGIKSIPGVEIYTCRNHLERTEGTHHLTLLAKNQAGYQNLLKLVSTAHTDGFYYKPRVDHGLLKKYCEGIMVLSGCISGELARAILADNQRLVDETIDFYASTFRDDFYLEIQSHPGDEFRKVLETTIALGRKLGIPLVATNDVHYVSQSDAPYQAMLSVIAKSKGPMADDYYLKSEEVMRREFVDCPEALDATLGVAAKVEEISLSSKVLVPVPPALRAKSESPDDYLESVCRTSLETKLGNPLPPEYEARLVYELGVIQKTGFASYLLLVTDICDFARKAGIRYGPRGSAAGSLVCHALGISRPDPIEHGLIFERFLNPDRIEMPDVDLDFQDDRRGEIYEYLKATYGEDHVGAIVAYSALGAKAAVRDAQRADPKRFPYAQAEMLTKAMGADPTLTIAKAREDARVQALLESDPSLADLLDVAGHLEGAFRQASTHAAGVVVSAVPITDLAPIMRAPRTEGKTQVQFQGEELHKAGLLKMDILGLDNLTVLDHAVKLVKERHGVDIDVWNLPWDDEVTYDLLCQGRVHGVFQLGTESGKRLTVDVQPRSIGDLMALVALNRPGPLDFAPKYAAVKNGREELESPHPLITEIVSETNGVIVYQEQVLQIAREMAGFTYAEADVLRKAIGKKIAELLAQQREKFVLGAIKHSEVTHEEAGAVWSYFEPFARYSFNKGHACSYGYLAYQTAYIKAHYVLEYMTSLLDVARDNQEKVAAGIAECHALGIEVLPPDVPYSGVGFTIEGDSIRFGLAAVKGVGVEVAKGLIEHGPYAEFKDVVTRNPSAHKPALEALAKVGAFPHGTRSAQLEVIPRLVAAVSKTQAKLDRGQLELFNLTDGLPEPPDIPEVPLAQRLQWERELCGICLTDNPLKRIAKLVQADVTVDAPVGEMATFVGEIRGPRVLLTRAKREPFVIASLVDMAGQIDAVCFPRLYQDTQEMWQEGMIVKVTGQVGERDSRRQVIVDSVEAYDLEDEPKAHTFVYEALRPWLDAYTLACERPGHHTLYFSIDGEVMTTQVSQDALSEIKQRWGSYVH